MSYGVTPQTYIVTGRTVADGTYDDTYGVGGISATVTGVASDAALDVDDRLYAVGGSGTNLVVWRFFP